ncbi:hypothetical protein ABGN05_29410, partial [Aquibium sp. LZ166]
CFSTIRHGSSSCGEDRLGPSEQPSDAQCRANHLTGRGGHTVLPLANKMARTIWALLVKGGIYRAPALMTKA